MNMPAHLHDELLDLLVKDTHEGLPAPEQQRLQQLLAEQPDGAWPADAFETSMAALTLAADSDPDTRSPALPEALANRILASAPVATGKVVTMAPRTRQPSAAVAQAGWWAAAACFALAVWGWWPRLMNQPVITSPVVSLTAAQQRAQLLQSGRAIQASWQPGNDPAATALQGDVVFDPVSQRGYLRFRGIPANDPRLAQYQLWIADGARTQPQPVDGGVFDVASDLNTPQATPEGDVIIPFEAKLQVGQPAAFVVTVEQPGGVVVSSQERVLALAPVGS